MGVGGMGGDEVGGGGVVRGGEDEDRGRAWRVMEGGGDGRGGEEEKRGKEV